MSDETTRTASALWSDWCAITGIPEAQRDQETLDRFARQARPSRRLLDHLRPQAEGDNRAPAWPSSRVGESLELETLLAHLAVLDTDRDTGWVTRLRLRRLGFASVLVAPRSQGGLGLTRDRLRALTPDVLQGRRPGIARSTTSADCPACAIWMWLEVVGTNDGWAHWSVKTLAHRPRRIDDADHQCHQPDSAGDWVDAATLLPAIDRWGYLDPYASLHVSSISVLLGSIPRMLDERDVRPPAEAVDEPEPRRRPTRHITVDEENAILARADELNTRVSAILAELG